MVMTKLKIFIIFVIILLVGAVFVTSKKIQITPKPPAQPTDTSESDKNVSATDKPQVVSTKPDPLEESIVAANEIIEITFNRPLENVGEFKSRIEPQISYKTELSGDRRSAKIIPEKPLELGTTFTLFIGPETKFDGVGRWGQERIFHFKTIPYRGI